MSDLKTSFAPLADDDVETLILGSLPGDRSLALGQYYGHPQNRFWKVIAHITGNSLPTTYPDKKMMLQRARIGLWDVAHRANRHGSLDSAIRDEEPNDIPAFIASHNNLKAIVFNGRQPEKMYDKYFGRQPGIDYISLPSTSPANAAMSVERLCERWRQVTREKN
jgi:hypoxanthine-DNA glycosylase